MARRIEAGDQMLSDFVAGLMSSEYTVTFWAQQIVGATATAGSVLGVDTEDGSPAIIYNRSGPNTLLARSTAGVYDTIGSTYVPAIGTWFHVAMTYPGNGGTTKPRGYIDGALRHSETGTLAVSAPSENAKVYINGQNHDIGHVAIFNRVLSTSEISELAGGKHPTLISGLVRYWPMDRGVEGTDDEPEWFGNGALYVSAGAPGVAPTDPPVDPLSIDIDVGLLWNVHAPAETDASLAWHVRSPVEAERSVEWNVREAVQQDASLAWDVREAVTADRTLLWHVSPVITVDVDCGLLWNVRAPVEAERSIAWRVRQGVEASNALEWHVRAAVEAERSLLWQIRAALNTDAVLRWNVGDAQTVELDVGLLWHVHAPVTIDRDLLWRIRERVELDREMRWNVGAAVVAGTPLDVIRLRAVIERGINVRTRIERVIRINATI